MLLAYPRFDAGQPTAADDGDTNEPSVSADITWKIRVPLWLLSQIYQVQQRTQTMAIL